MQKWMNRGAQQVQSEEAAKEIAETTAQPRRQPKRKVCEVSPSQPPRELSEEAEANLQAAEKHNPSGCDANAD